MAKNRIFTPESKKDGAYYDQIIKDLMKEISDVEKRIKARHTRFNASVKTKLETTDTNIALYEPEPMSAKFNRQEISLKDTSIDQKQKTIEKLREVVSKKRSELRRAEEKISDAEQFLKDYFSRTGGQEGHDRYTAIMDRMPKEERKKWRIMDSGQVFEVDRIYVQGGGMMTWDEAAKEYLRRGLGTEEDLAIF